jgi:hypothetical protein
MRARQVFQLAVLAGVLCCFSRTSAQESDEIVSNPDVQLSPSRVDRSINFSLREAANWERQARELTRKGEAEKAVDAWREAFARYEAMWRDELSPDKPTEKEPLACAITFPPGKDRDLSPQYIENWITLPDYINGRMRQPDWPRQFKDRMSLRQSGPGQEMLSRALANNDMKLMRRVARYYQFSPSGIRALRTLAEVALERGDSLLAQRWLFELGEAHPDEYRRDPYLWVQLVRACRESDTRFYLAKALADFERNARDATVDVGGVKVNALKYAKELAEQPVPGDRRELGSTGWRTLQGESGRNRVAPPVESIGEMLDFAPAEGVQGFQLTTGSQTDSREDEYRYYGPQPKQVSHLNFPTIHSSGIYIHQLAAKANNTVRSEQLLFFGHGSETRAQPMTIKAGLEYPQPKEQNNGYRYYYMARESRPRNRVLASTIGRLTWAVEPKEHDVLFAILGEGNPSTSDDALRSGNQIQAFDLTDEGKLLVTLPNEKIESPDDWKVLQNIVFNGAPLIHNNKLYVSGTRAQRGSTESWVFCFDVTPRGDFSRGEGKLQWKTMICAKKSQGSMGWEELPAEAIEVSSLAEQGGMLYVSTNMGACAGLDRDTGELCWAAKYERPSPRSTSELGWTGNAPVAFGGLVVIAPDDSRFAFVLDGLWGKKNFEHPMHGRGAPGEFNYVLGVVDNALIIQGRRKLYSVSLTSFRRGGVKHNAADWGSLNWETENKFDATPFGRGVIAGDKILVPLKGSVALYDVVTGKLDTRIPLPDTIEFEKEPYTLSVYCRGEAIKDQDGAVRGYRPVTVTDSATGSVYSVEHLRNGDTFTLPGSGKTETVKKETFVVMASSKWLYAFAASDKKE